MLEHKASNFAFAGLRTMMNFMAYNFPKLRKNIVNIGSNEILVKHSHYFKLSLSFYIYIYNKYYSQYDNKLSPDYT